MAFKSKHILAIEDLSRQDVLEIFTLAKKFKSSPDHSATALKGKMVVNLFFEPSTRTRMSFEMAARRLGASCMNITAQQSSTVKGETLLDTAKNIEAMNPDVLIIRHFSSGAPYVFSKILKTPIINAGDGFHEHPTQALLDLFTIEEAKKKISGLRVVIVGDIAHSRVARSNLALLKKMGAKVYVCGPPTLIPPLMASLCDGVFYDLRKALASCDVVMMLRIQEERQMLNQYPSKQEYSRYYGLNSETLHNASKHILILHPGPLNRGIEITPEIADSPISLILNQVKNGVAIRMALLYVLARGGKIAAH